MRSGLGPAACCNIAERRRSFCLVVAGEGVSDWGQRRRSLEQ